MTDFDRREGRATGLSKEPNDPPMLLSIIEKHGFALIKELRAAGYQIPSVQVMPLGAEGAPLLTMPMLCMDLPKVSA
jgi:hypothetical protein